MTLYLPLVSREWKNGSNSSYNCTPFLHSLLTKGKSTVRAYLNPEQPTFLGLPYKGRLFGVKVASMIY